MQEFQGKDANYINSRIRYELDQMDSADRNDFWASYNAQVVAFRDDHSKHAFLVHLLDSFLTKNRKNGYLQQVNPTSAYFFPPLSRYIVQGLKKIWGKKRKKKSQNINFTSILFFSFDCT
jgi:hypothetical protein